MAFLTLREINKKYPIISKYKIWDIQCICNYKIRGKKDLVDKDRRILRLHNVVLDKDEEMRDRKIKLFEKYKSLNNVPEAEKNKEIKREWAFWALYSELVEALERGGYLELLPKQTQKQIDEMLNHSENESAKPSYRKAKPTFRTGESQGRGMIRNMNKITRIAVKRFQK